MHLALEMSLQVQPDLTEELGRGPGPVLRSPETLALKGSFSRSTGGGPAAPWDQNGKSNQGLCLCSASPSERPFPGKAKPGRLTEQ